MPDQVFDLLYALEVLGVTLGFVVVFAGIFFCLIYIVFLVWKYRDREKRSLEYVLLQVATPRDNETKIDAAEQMFSSLHALHHGGFWSFLKPQDHISFEIVARREDIRFLLQSLSTLWIW